MLRVLILFIFIAVPEICCAGVVLEGGCYSDCTLINNSRLSCAVTTCDGYSAPHSGVDSAMQPFKNSVYNDVCKVYNGSSWIPCVRKRYDGSVWQSLEHDWHIIPAEARHILLLKVLPGRPGYTGGTLDADPALPAINNSVQVTCTNAIVSKLYFHPTSGATCAYPIDLRCNDANTWSGSRTFFISPNRAKQKIALFLASMQTGFSLSITLTSYTQYSFILDMSVSKY